MHPISSPTMPLTQSVPAAFRACACPPPSLSLESGLVAAMWSETPGRRTGKTGGSALEATKQCQPQAQPLLKSRATSCLTTHPRDFLTSKTEQLEAVLGNPWESLAFAVWSKVEEEGCQWGRGTRSPALCALASAKSYHGGHWDLPRCPHSHFGCLSCPQIGQHLPRHLISRMRPGEDTHNIYLGS